MVYSKYKDSGVDWLGDIPAHWVIDRLKWTVNGCQNGIWGGEPDGIDDIACIRVADFDRVKFVVNTEEPTLRAVTQKEKQTRILRSGDLLLEKSGGGELQPVGVVVTYLHDTDAVCSNFVARLNVCDDFCSRFLTYLYAHLYARRVNIRSIKQTTGIQNLDSSAYLNERVSWPSYEEQRAIAEYLDQETARIDALIGKKQRQIELLHEKRAALISHAVTKGINPKVKKKDSGIEWLGDVPTHWICRKLGYIANMSGGSTPSKLNEEYWIGDIPWVSPKDMKRRVIDDSTDHVSQSAITDTSLRLIQPPVVLIVVRGMILAHTFPVAITTAPVTINQDMKALNPKQGINADYLAFLLEGISSLILSHIEESAHGTKCLRTDLWKNISVFMPDEEEQSMICEYLHTEGERLERTMDRVLHSIDLLNEYRTALISAAVTGKIDVRNEAK